MITVLDGREYFYWMPLHFVYDGETVYIRLEELFVNPETVDIHIYDDNFIKDAHKIESTKDSKRYDLIFNDVVFFQVYEELRHIESVDEEFDEGIIRKYTKSTLMNFVENNTTFKTEVEDLFKNMIHYCVRTSTDWFDIIALSDPIIELVDQKQNGK
ncbi:MAG: hypothetical protein FWG13_01935 [Leptospirales bacterium]|nr:hypothetical protein [Leptospirales bacterium]